LTGKGLEVYTSMPPEEANDYNALKKAVLKPYQLTEEGFRQRFRESSQNMGIPFFSSWQVYCVISIDGQRWLRLMKRTRVCRDESPRAVYTDVLARASFVFERTKPEIHCRSYKVGRAIHQGSWWFHHIQKGEQTEQWDVLQTVSETKHSSSSQTTPTSEVWESKENMYHKQERWAFRP